MEFSENLLVDISTAWEQADVNQKPRLQNILFPNGLKYHPEKGILNADNDSLFNCLEGFMAGQNINGAPGEIRTPDLMLRRHSLYPAELRARFVVGQL